MRLRGPHRRHRLLSSAALCTRTIAIMTTEPDRPVSGTCFGERCYCGELAEHKVEEAIPFDDPIPSRHPLTAYVCHRHFRLMMGPAADIRL